MKDSGLSPLYIFQCGEQKNMTVEDLACSLITHQHMDLYFEDDIRKEQVWNKVEAIQSMKNDSTVCSSVLNVALHHHNVNDTGCCYCPRLTDTVKP